MKPTRLLATAAAPDGTPLTLHEHDGAISIRAAGVELMSTREHHSEERLAALACSGLVDRRGASVLIGGLGLGFTLREALQTLAADATVVVAELVPAVIEWNRDPTLGLAADALADPRVEIVAGDVAAVIAAGRGRFDRILLDVDNGPRGLTAAANDGLYGAAGLAAAWRALKSGGTLAVWSATADPAFAARMAAAGFTVTEERPRTRPGGGGRTTVFVGTRGEDEQVVRGRQRDRGPRRG